MKTYTQGNITIEMSSDLLEEMLNLYNQENIPVTTKNKILQTESRMIQSRLKKDNLTNRIIREYQKRTKNNRIIYLSAHGIESPKRWLYQDRQRKLSIDNWIRKREKAYSCLIIGVCNPNSHITHPKKSIVLAPNNDWSEFREKMCEVQMELHTPNGIIDSYMKEWYLNQILTECLAPQARQCK